MFQQKQFTVKARSKIKKMADWFIILINFPFDKIVNWIIYNHQTFNDYYKC